MQAELAWQASQHTVEYWHDTWSALQPNISWWQGAGSNLGAKTGTGQQQQPQQRHQEQGPHKQQGKLGRQQHVRTWRVLFQTRGGEAVRQLTNLNELLERCSAWQYIDRASGWAHRARCGVWAATPAPAVIAGGLLGLPWLRSIAGIQAHTLPACACPASASGAKAAMLLGIVCFSASQTCPGCSLLAWHLPAVAQTADIAVGVHGANTANALFMRPGSSLIGASAEQRPGGP